MADPVRVSIELPAADVDISGARHVVDVLVADDDDDIRRMLGLRLRARGFRVAAATDARTTIDHVLSRPTDVVFLDMDLPDMSGLEVLDHLRQRMVDVAIVLMTAFGSERTAIGALRYMADDYLPKPFRADELQAVIDRTTRRLELKRQNVALSERLERTNQELQAELARAAEVQASLLPDTVPDVPGFDLAARCLPARSVGGDFYDWQQPEPGVLTFVVCDVMGKGMPAALTMSEVRAVLRTVARRGPPDEALSEAADAVGDDLERNGQFVTALLARLDVPARRVTFADAGHGLALVRRADGSLDPLHRRGFPLGLFGAERYDSTSTTLGPGDALVVYSDGLMEGLPEDRRDREAVADLVAEASGAGEAVDRLVAAGRSRIALADDLTVVVLWGLAG